MEMVSTIPQVSATSESWAFRAGVDLDYESIMIIIQNAFFRIHP